MDSASIAVIGTIILLTACHGFAVWLLMTSRKDAGSFAESLGATLAYIADSAAEAGRISADIADALERLEGGFTVASPAASGLLTPMTGEPTLAGLATSLLGDYISNLPHGSEAEPERTIHEHEAETPPSEPGESA